MITEQTAAHPGGRAAGHTLDDDLVRRLVAGRFPQWAALPVERFPSGGTVNAVYRLGDDMTVRLPLAQGGAGDVAMEQEWLPRLAPLLPTAVPRVLGAGEPAEGFPWPWSVYGWLAGENPEAGAVAAPELLAADLAAFVAAMRSITLPAADGPGRRTGAPTPPVAHRGGPLALQDAGTREGIAALRGIPEEGVDCDAVAAVWDDAMRAPEPDGPPVWLHADLMPGNLLVDGATGRLTAVIDFGCAGVGDPACDLFPAWNLLPAGARQVFREALGVDDATWARGRARTLSQAVIALPYYRNSNPAMARNARHVIRAVLAEA
ncbi:aminoglycoside phosphotransferase family protein [Streptomyces sp. NBC_00239]|uniref:aminoglycoside phosphotransferase family protein n=1 Tax=Streptomyces sp. NBC_00239 TaxID=2903640 RepID=UPI002E2B1915|nr:aminoglycoside phosphotransferase family protein [Streptomyces sp. NBC_00239]